MADLPSDLPADRLPQVTPAMHTTTAVQQSKLVVMGYGDLVSGPRTIQGAEHLARHLRSSGR